MGSVNGKLIAYGCIIQMVMTGNFDHLWADYTYGKFNPSTFADPAAVVLVAWNSEAGLERLARAEYKTDYYQLVHHYQPQINPLYCGIATSVIVLNAMRLDRGRVPSQKALEVKTPRAWGGGEIPFRHYTQATFLNAETDRVKTRAVIDLENITAANSDDPTAFSPGLALAELKAVLEVYGLQVDLHHAAEDPQTGIQRFRQTIEAVLGDESRFLIVNFVGRLIGAPTGGHISPVVAYDRKTDSVLLLDVAGHKNPWYWVPVEHLYLSMHTQDGGKYRGWLAVEDTLI